MWCDVMCGHVMWGVVLSPDVIWCEVKWSDVKWCNGMGCNVVGCALGWCDAMWLCDVLNWEVTCCDLRRPVTRRRFQCAVKPWDAKRKTPRESSCHSTTTLYYDSVLQSTTHEYNVATAFMQLRHSCLVLITHESSSASRGATYGMQNPMERPLWNIQYIAGSNQRPVH